MKMSNTELMTVDDVGNIGDIPMDAARRAELVARGHEVWDDARDACGLTEVDRAIFDLRSDLAARIKLARSRAKISQRELARRMKTTQPVVSRLEAGDLAIGLGTLIEAWAALGGQVRLDGPPTASK